MSEELKEYVSISEEKTKLFLSKRLSDAAKDLDKLNGEDKKFIIERILNRAGLVELYNALGEYME